MNRPDNSHTPLPGRPDRSAADPAEQARRSFEADWLAGRRTRIEDYLPTDPGTGHSALLARLLSLEIELREEVGERPNEEEYLRRFPSHRALVHEVFSAWHTLPSPVTADPPVVSPPTRIGPYRIVREIGRGGMGVVYEAVHETLEQRVALKVLLGALPDPTYVARFQREAKAVAGLHHTNIVPVFGAGEDGGLHYHVMQFIEGQPLNLVLAGPRAEGGFAALPTRPGGTYWEAVARLGAQVADALDHAHSRNVLHRDVKPSNLLLDATGTVWVTDFGLAKGLDDGNLTQPGETVGTVQYMAPERFAGKSDRRSDVYGLGATLYEFTARRPAYPNTDPRQLIANVLHVDPPPPRSVNPAVPRNLDTIIRKAMAREPARRYQTAKALADDLRRFADGRPILARPLSRVTLAALWARRNPALAGMAAALFFAVVIGFAGVMAKWRDAVVAQREAQSVAARAVVERGINLCEQAEYGPGLLWLARGVEQAPAADPNRESYQTILTGWAQQLHPLRAALDHPSPVSALAFAPDSRQLATGDEAGTVRIWSLPAPEPASIAAPREPIVTVSVPGKVRAIGFAPDGRLFAVKGSDGRVSLFDTATGVRRPPLEAPNGGVRWLAFTPDGKTLVAAGGFAFAAWDVETGRLRWGKSLDRAARQIILAPDGATALLVFNRGPSELRSVGGGEVVRRFPARLPAHHGVFSPDGSVVVIVEKDGDRLDHDASVARAWDTRTGETTGREWTHETNPQITCAAFSPDGGTLVTGGADDFAHAWDARTGAAKFTTPRHRKEITGVRFLGGGRLFTTQCDDGTVRVWDAASGTPVGQALFHSSDSTADHEVAPDGRTAAMVGDDHVVRLWDVSVNRSLGRRIGAKQRFVLGVAFGPDGGLHVAGEKTATRFDPETFAPAGELRMESGPVGGIAVSPDGSRAVTGGYDHEAVVWDLATGRPLFRLRHEAMPWVTAVAFSPDGTRIATGAGDYTNRGGDARLWDAATGELLTDLGGHKREVIHVAFSPNGRVLTTCSRDYLTRFWDAATGRPVGEPIAHTSWVHAAAISPDGKTLLTGSDKEQLVIWGLPDRQRVGEVVRHSGVVRAVGFSPDGRLYLTGSVDATARVWEARTRRPVGPPLRHGSEVGSLAVRGDGRLFATGSTDGYARVWPLPTAESRVSREWIEAHTGLTIGPDDEIDALPPAVWRARLAVGTGAK